MSSLFLNVVECFLIGCRMKQHTVEERPQTWKEMMNRYCEDELHELISSGDVSEV